MKHLIQHHQKIKDQSPPARGRGLKLKRCFGFLRKLSRPPRGGVD